MKVFRKIANVIAIIFHPSFVGCFLLLFFSFTENDLSLNQHILIAAEIIALNIIIPISATYFIYKDVHLPNRKSRFIPLIISFLCQLLLVYLLKDHFIEGPVILCAILLCINLLVLLAFNIFIKASIHANAISVVFCLFALFYLIGAEYNEIKPHFYISFCAFLIISCIILWQRKISGAHSMLELITGFVSGILSIALTLFYIDIFGY